MLLAIDSATRKIGIALYDGVEVLHEAVWNSPRQHTVTLAPAIQKALAAAGLGPHDLKVLGLAIGPGSYTGLRIGAALAKGLAFAQHLPIVTIPTFDILAAAQTVVEDTQLAVILEAGRSRLGVGWFQAVDGKWEPGKESGLFTPAEFSKKIRKPTLVCGELTAQVRKALSRKRKNVTILSPANSLRRPSYLAELAWARWQADDSDDPAEISPVYLQTNANLSA